HELNTRQAGVLQPRHAPVPTDFRLLMLALNAKNSWPATRSASPAAETAKPPIMRAVFVPGTAVVPTLYAARPPAAAPAAQSKQATAAGEMVAFIVSEEARQVSVFLNCHQSGNTVLAVATSMTSSTPETCVRSAPSSNE